MKTIKYFDNIYAKAEKAKTHVEAAAILYTAIAKMTQEQQKEFVEYIEARVKQEKQIAEELEKMQKRKERRERYLMFGVTVPKVSKAMFVDRNGNIILGYDLTF